MFREKRKIGALMKANAKGWAAIAQWQDKILDSRDHEFATRCNTKIRTLKNCIHKRIASIEEAERVLTVLQNRLKSPEEK